MSVALRRADPVLELEDDALRALVPNARDLGQGNQVFPGNRPAKVVWAGCAAGREALRASDRGDHRCL